MNGTIINFSKLTFGGNTPQLQWGKWKNSPSFPLNPQSTSTFTACGVSVCYIVQLYISLISLIYLPISAHHIYNGSTSTAYRQQNRQEKKLILSRPSYLSMIKLMFIAICQKDINKIFHVYNMFVLQRNELACSFINILKNKMQIIIVRVAIMILLYNYMNL